MDSNSKLCSRCKTRPGVNDLRPLRYCNVCFYAADQDISDPIMDGSWKLDPVTVFLTMDEHSEYL